MRPSPLSVQGLKSSIMCNAPGFFKDPSRVVPLFKLFDQPFLIMFIEDW